MERRRTGSKRLAFLAPPPLATIPPPLRDRMEVMDLSGYTEEDKLAIARQFPIARQVPANGLGADRIVFGDERLREVLRGYTREAGVRRPEREIGAICRAGVMVSVFNETYKELFNLSMSGIAVPGVTVPANPT